MFDAFCKNTLVPLILRAGLAAVFIFHGLDLVSKEGGTAWDEHLGLSKPEQAAVAWGQLIGGIAVAIGFLTRLAALGLAVIMGGAIAQVHWEHGFDIRDHGWEYNYVILVVCAALILMGGGSLAVDRFFRMRRKTSS
jgi:putative oxidoreductase